MDYKRAISLAPAAFGIFLILQGISGIRLIPADFMAVILGEYTPHGFLLSFFAYPIAYLAILLSMLALYRLYWNFSSAYTARHQEKMLKAARLHNIINTYMQGYLSNARSYYDSFIYEIGMWVLSFFTTIFSATIFVITGLVPNTGGHFEYMMLNLFIGFFILHKTTFRYFKIMLDRILGGIHLV